MYLYIYSIEHRLQLSTPLACFLYLQQRNFPNKKCHVYFVTRHSIGVVYGGIPDIVIP